jgi:sigma-E factor negative regulatory protein RseC
MQEIGIVKSIDGVIARVMVTKKSSFCENCTKDSCDIPEDGVETDAFNAVGAKVGQKVRIELKSYTYYKGALLVYVLPVIALIAGAILGKIYLPAYLNGTDSDLLAAIGGFLSFLVSLLFVKLLVKRMEGKTESKSVIESVLEG